MSKEQFDKLLNKWISRKLLVFVIATIYLACGLINSSQWVYIAIMYIGVEAYLNKYKQ